MSQLATKVSTLLAKVLRLDRAADEPVVATAASNVAGEALPRYGVSDEPLQCTQLVRASAR